MTGWIRECVESHKECALTEQKFIPTRLIQLNATDSHNTRLASPATPVRYAALSYCWGSSAQSKTTKANVSARRTHLDTSLLPQTLQDALFIAAKLGLRYIWIDAVCIIQDDADAWATEAAAMADVYSNAHIVLVATAADDCSQGFLWPRKQPLVIQCAPDSKSTFNVSARYNNSHDCTLRNDNANYPLFKRGWCMQERFVARRTIHFLADELRFECRSTRICECNSSTGEADWYKAESDSYRRITALQKPKEISDIAFGTLWNGVVHGYSGKQFTHDNDVLPALSGIARRLECLKPGTYLAGLWERGLVMQLAWYCSEGATEPRDFDSWQGSTLPRPTFSWMSSSKPVSFPQHHIKGVSDAVGKMSKISPSCKLLSSNVRLLSTDTYGRISDASICLRGPLASGPDVFARLTKDYLRNDPAYGHAQVHLDAGLHFVSSGKRIDQELYEHLKSAMDCDSVVCLELYRYKFVDHHHADFLVLRRTIYDNAYVRIGVILHQWWASFKTSYGQSVTIV